MPGVVFQYSTQQLEGVNGMGMLTNCVNCGAPLQGSTCGYCGTRYAGNKVQACFGEGQAAGTLTVGGEEFEVYLQSVEIKQYVAEAERDWRGRMHRSLGRTRRRFVLVEP